MAFTKEIKQSVLSNGRAYFYELFQYGMMKTNSNFEMQTDSLKFSQAVQKGFVIEMS